MPLESLPCAGRRSVIVGQTIVGNYAGFPSAQTPRARQVPGAETRPQILLTKRKSYAPFGAVTVSAVPEPMTRSMLLAGLLVVGAVARRRA